MKTITLLLILCCAPSLLEAGNRQFLGYDIDGRKIYGVRSGNYGAARIGNERIAFRYSGRTTYYWTPYSAGMFIGPQIPYQPRPWIMR